jgi:hypothetical protein
MEQNMKALTIILAVLTLLAIGALILFTDRIPPDCLTKNRMDGLQWRIRQSAQEHHCLPDSLSQLEKREGYDNSSDDGWGREIIYTPNPDGTVTLSSFGKSGKPGSKDSIIVTFTVQLSATDSQK